MEGMFSQQVPGIMEYFFFKLGITVSKAMRAIAAESSSGLLLPFLLPGFCVL